MTVANFLRMAVNAQRRGPDGEENPIRIPEFRKLLSENMEQLKIDRRMTSRYLNDGFSGGEKKRMEMLQMAMLQPKLAILDETDSGLDIDALRIVSDGVNRLTGPELGVLVITHYSRLLQYIRPDRVHVLVGGRVVSPAAPSLPTSSNATAMRPTAWRRRQSDGRHRANPRRERRSRDRRVQVRLPRRRHLVLQVAGAAWTRRSCARSRRTSPSRSG